MTETIPDLLSWSMGPNLRRDGEYDYAMVAILDEVGAKIKYAYAQQHLEAWYFAIPRTSEPTSAMRLEIDTSKPDEIENPKDHLKNVLDDRVYTARISERYVNHPMHRQVAQELGRPIFESREIADYEFDPEEEMWEPQVQEVWTEIGDTVAGQHGPGGHRRAERLLRRWPGGADRMKGDLSFVEAMRENLCG